MSVDVKGPILSFITPKSFGLESSYVGAGAVGGGAAGVQMTQQQQQRQPLKQHQELQQELKPKQETNDKNETVTGGYEELNIKDEEIKRRHTRGADDAP